MGHWIAGLAVTAIGLLGLVVAARTEDPVMHATGLTVFAAAVLFDFWTIRQTVGSNR